MVTPCESYADLAQAIGIKSLYFKREDLHPLGSHKGRSIPHMIDKGLAEGVRHFAISSSGNAALAAGLYVKSLNDVNKKNDFITLEIFAGKKINPKKLAKLQALKDKHILISVQDRPLQILFNKTKDPTVRSLRQSTDDVALVGYKDLARELAEIPDLEAIFIGTSSGTTAEALAQYFASAIGHVEIHIVQTASCHPIVKALEKARQTQEAAGITANIATDEVSIADAIVDRTAERARALVPLIQKIGGAGWIADNESIQIAQDIVKKHTHIAISANSALSVAGLMHAVYTGRNWKGSVVCMICGE